ncbi:hypothetical protein CRUP_032603 [Coryphaenoides rupestris]|nr:hypothetical protein CRUP_032603 [Coryphaenoides rupestris]
MDTVDSSAVWKVHAHRLEAMVQGKPVPVIALSASGGGTRAMTGLLGSLKGLQEIGLLDAVTYITGVSGSTWCMSTLYQQDDWSQHNLDGAIEAINDQMIKGLSASFSLDNINSYRREMQKKTQEGHMVSFIDFWGMALEHLIFGKRTESTLSDQERAVEQGQNPLPIYTAVNIKDAVTGNKQEAEWCEFTPYEVGLGKYGAFTSAKKFGSQFFLGHLLKKLPEFPLSYLLGIWSSAMSVSYGDFWNFVTGATAEAEQDVDKKEQSTFDMLLLNPLTNLSESTVNFFRSRPVVAKTYNFMRGFFMHWKYSENRNFNAWKHLHPDAYPNRLTPADPTMHLVDAGHAINTGFVPVLRPERGTDVIISISNSWDPDNLLDVIKKTAIYCKDHEIPFPSIDFKKAAAEPQKEVYVFQDENNPEAPIVIHLPLVNLTYQKYKAPGVLRESEAELRAGQVDVSSDSSPYTTKNFSYSSEDFHALVDLTEQASPECVYSAQNAM